MNFIWEIKRHVKIKTLIFAIPYFSFFIATVFAQSNTGSIAFTKKEIAFFKWGNGKNEVTCSNFNTVIHRGSDEKNNLDVQSFRAPVDLKIDGYNNIYIDGGNERIFVISSDGSSIKTINSNTTGGLGIVDEEGNIYGPYYKNGQLLGSIRTNPDGSQTVYKNFELRHVVNGIGYEIKKKKIRTIKIYDTDNKSEKLPPLMFPMNLRAYSPTGEGDYLEDPKKGLITIYTNKINSHLAKINKRINTDKILIQTDENSSNGIVIHLLGIDDKGNTYILNYKTGLHIDDPWSKVYVKVYSSDGKAIATIPIENDYFSKQLVPNEFALDVQGNLYQMWRSKDGVHILKWENF